MQINPYLLFALRAFLLQGSIALVWYVAITRLL
jgi:hypothetical protein